MNKLGWFLTGAYSMTIIVSIIISYYGGDSPLLDAFSVIGIGINILLLRDKGLFGTSDTLYPKGHKKGMKVKE